MRAKSKQQKDLQRKLNHYNAKSLEEKLAKDYAHTHSLKTISQFGLKETIFTGTPQELTGTVLAEVGALRSGEVPDYPQGLVIHDSKGQGAFD